MVGRRQRISTLESLEPRTFLSAAELIRNGGFEGTVANSDWVRSGNFQADSRFTNFHSGAGYAYLSNVDGSSGNSISGEMSQDLTIPSTASSLTLNFWTKITTSETTGALANDVMSVVVKDATGTNTLQTLATYSNANSSSSYVQRTFFLDRSLIGQSVRLVFSGSTNATLATTFRVDDVSLNAVSPATSNRVVGYLPQYRYTAAFSKLDLSALTHVNYFSISSNDDGSINTGGVPDMDTAISVLHAAGVGVSITIGPESFTNLAASSAARSAFATNMVNYCLAHNLDGIDIDWEPPAGNNVTNYGLLIDDLYTAAHPKHLLITAAVNPWTNEIPKAPVNAKMDWLNVMCYDFAPANHSTYDAAVGGMVDWTNYGVTKNKIVMGVPFYGKQGTDWSNDSSITYGGALSNEMTQTGAYPSPDDDFVQGFYYNGVETLRKKAQYVASNGYGGMMIWELGQDHWNGSSQYDQWSLLPVLKSIMMPSTSITSVTTSLADNAYAPLNQTKTLGVTVSGTFATSGVLEVSLISDTATRAWVYINAAGATTQTLNLGLTDAVAGLEFYEIYTQFRPGVSSGPFSNVLGSDALKVTPFHLNWQQFPSTPVSPNPGNGATLATAPTLLDWADAPSATSYDVYLNGVLRGNVASSQWTPNVTIAAGASHTWQVVAKNVYGTAPGATWNMTIVAPDTTPPAFSSASIDVNARQITITATEALATSPVGNAFVTLSPGGSPIDIGTGVVSGSTVKFTLPISLSDGNYTLTLPAGTVKDTANNAQNSAWNAPFFVLTGDADHNGQINSSDFAALALNFNKPGGAKFDEGDFNYDGKVNALDFNALASRFGTSNPAPASVAISRPISTGQLFSEKSVTEESDDLLSLSA